MEPGVPPAEESVDGGAEEDFRGPGGGIEHFLAKPVDKRKVNR